MNSNLLKEYFEKTSREQVLKDWAETQKYDKVGISIETYWKESDKTLYKTPEIKLKSLEAGKTKVIAKL